MRRTKRFGDTTPQNEKDLANRTTMLVWACALLFLIVSIFDLSLSLK